jgi:alpha-aminoadipic semialdehyde synthase
MHLRVARHCIEHGKHLVTASYVSPEMQTLNEAWVDFLLQPSAYLKASAIEKDVLILGECGLDPGIDTM